MGKKSRRMKTKQTNGELMATKVKMTKKVLLAKYTETPYVSIKDNVKVVNAFAVLSHGDGMGYYNQNVVSKKATIHSKKHRTTLLPMDGGDIDYIQISERIYNENKK